MRSPAWPTTLSDSWRVSATNAGGTSSYSAADSFTTIIATPTPPTLSQPANGATGVSINPTLSWNVSTGAATYTLQVSTSNTFSPFQTNQTGISATSYAITSLANNSKYFWRVSATNAGGTSSYSVPDSFTTIIAAPSPPTLSLPANGATGVLIPPLLGWTNPTGATSYTLQVSTTSNFSSFSFNQSGLTSTSYPVIGLSNNTKYYWRVSATNAGGTSSFSSPDSFTTIIASPGAPSNPKASPTTTGAALSWDPAVGAAWYIVEVYNGVFQTVFRDSVIVSPSNVSNLSSGTAYSWRVQAWNIAGPGTGITSTFRTPVPLPAAPGNLSATPTNSGATLSWGVVSGATSYVVEVYTDNTLRNSVARDSLISPPSSVGGLSAGTTCTPGGSRQSTRAALVIGRFLLSRRWLSVQH